MEIKNLEIMTDEMLKKRISLLYGIMVGMIYAQSFIDDFNWGKVISMLVGLVVGEYIINKD